MKHNVLTSTPRLTRKQLIELLNQDLACEYQAVIAYMVYSEILQRRSYLDVAQELQLHAADEFHHATRIATQIKDLGGVPCAIIEAIMPAIHPGAGHPTEPARKRPTRGRHRHPSLHTGAPAALELSDALRSIIMQEPHCESQSTRSCRHANHGGTNDIA
jgi:bacterioferritin